MNDMPFSKPWLGPKRVAFVPLVRTNAIPPDQVPPDWENAILRRVAYDPRREANGADRSLRAWVRAASSGRADIDPLVLPMQTIDKQVVEANELEGRLGGRLRDQGMDAAVLVMLGGRGAGTNDGFWSRVVMAESNGVWLMELIHGLTGFKDLYHFRDDVDPAERSIDTFDQMAASSQTHPTAFTKNELGWLDAAAIRLHAGGSVEYELSYLSLAQPPVAERAAAVRIGSGFPYMMVEARRMTDQFEAGMPSLGDGQERGIASEGVIAYRVQTRNPTVQAREGNKKPLFLMTQRALQPGQSAALDDGVTLSVTGARPDGFAIRVDAPFGSGQLLAYGDAGTPGNVSNPVIVGLGGWLEFTRVFAGRNAAGEHRIYAVDRQGRLLSYGDAGTLGNVSSPMVVGFGGWSVFTFLFAGRNVAGADRIYAVDQQGQLLSYGDAGTPGNVSSPMVVGFGGWSAFKFLFAGRNAAGADRIYAVDRQGRLLSYGDAGTPGNVSNPVVVGLGGWQQFTFLFAGRNAAGADCIYAVDQQGRLLSYGDAGTPGNVSNPVVVGLGGWQQFRFLFAGGNSAGQSRIYGVVA
jgi:hypothetical protein